MTCEHAMERHQYWDECTRCGARWSPEHGWNVPMSTQPRYTYGGAALLQQMERARQVMARHHELLLGAGAKRDGMDGYSMPEGFTAEQGHQLWEEAQK